LLNCFLHPVAILIFGMVISLFFFFFPSSHFELK
jgi:hypothetical protein